MIFVITYNYPHRKTQDLLFRLVAKKYDEITVFSTPWVDRKNFVPYMPHRPFEFHSNATINIYPKELSAKLGFNYFELNNLDDLPTIKKDDYVLIGGAGIIKKELTDSKKIINSHPAYLPYVRGLDSMKWAILNDQPLGVTSHIISEEADQGWLIKRLLVPMFEWDTFHSVAIRQYEMEMDLLANAVEDISSASMKSLKKDNIPVFRRMPNNLQKEMFDYFPTYLKKQLKTR
tara:strand:+ start:1320 stop:2015 length:696 start_codon:yes stop_codon:yes gene_type:complete